MKKMARFICTVFAGPKVDDLLTEPQGFSVAVRLLREEWHRNSFGILRFTRLLLVLGNFIFFGTLLLDQLHRSNSRRLVGLCRDSYYLLQLMFFMLVLFANLWTAPWAIAVSIYFSVDILHKLAGQSFIWGKYSIDPQRSIVLFLINYAEITMCFASLYLHFECLKPKPTGPIEALYFSLVTATTVGYGDICPSDNIGHAIVVVQLMVFVVFVLLFLNSLLPQLTQEKRVN